MDRQEEGSKRGVGTAQRVSIAFMLSVLGSFGSPASAQGTVWDGPYVWFPVLFDGPPHQTRMVREVVHAGVIGKPGPEQGKVVLWRTWTGGDALHGGVWIWDPSSPASVTIASMDGSPQQLENIFCAGNNWDGDGNLLVTGGERSVFCGPQPIWTYTFDPAQPWFSQLPDCPPPPITPVPNRWGMYYPSTILLHDGRSLCVGGGSTPQNTACNDEVVTYNNSFLVFNRLLSRWEGLYPGQPNDAGIPGLPPFQRGTLTDHFWFRYYPPLHLLSTGHVFAPVCTTNQYTNGGAVSPSAIVDVKTGTPQTWQWAYRSAPNPQQPVWFDTYYPCSFLWPRDLAQQPTPGGDRVVVLGGTDTNNPWAPPNGRPAMPNTFHIQSPDLATSTWQINQPLPAMAQPRIFANSVLLPTQQLVVVGGCTHDFGPYGYYSGFEVDPIPVYQPEIIDLTPGSQNWTALPPHHSPRLYHTAAVLLPDARVLVTGGYRGTRPQWPGTALHSDAEILYPPYLWDATPRPVFANPQPPSIVTYGQAPTQIGVTIPGETNPAQEIDSVVLMRCGATTHHIDWDQRCIILPITNVGSTTLTIGWPAARTAGGTPGGDCVAPPGYYMLFLVRKHPDGVSRVPGIAHFVQLQ